MTKIIQEKPLSNVALALLKAGQTPTVEWHINSVNDLLEEPEFHTYVTAPKLVLDSNFHPSCRVTVGEESSLFDHRLSFTASFADMQIVRIGIKELEDWGWNEHTKLNAEESSVFDYLLENHPDLMSTDSITINDSIKAGLIKYAEANAPYEHQAKANQQIYMNMNHLMCFSGFSESYTLDHTAWILAHQASAFNESKSNHVNGVMTEKTKLLQEITYKEITFYIQKDVEVSLSANDEVSVTELNNDVVFSAKTATGDVYENLPPVIVNDFFDKHLKINKVDELPESVKKTMCESFKYSLLGHYG